MIKLEAKTWILAGTKHLGTLILEGYALFLFVWVSPNSCSKFLLN
jgi:hypothetical protein